VIRRPKPMMFAKFVKRLKYNYDRGVGCAWAVPWKAQLRSRRRMRLGGAMESMVITIPNGIRNFIRDPGLPHHCLLVANGRIHAAHFCSPQSSTTQPNRLRKYELCDQALFSSFIVMPACRSRLTGSTRSSSCCRFP
jgi:hypothetical protein